MRVIASASQSRVFSDSMPLAVELPNPPAVERVARGYDGPVSVIVRRPTRGGITVDVHVPGQGKEAMRDVLRRVLGEARAARAQGSLADKDAVTAVGNKTWSLRRDTDIDKLVEELVEAALGP